MKITPKRLREIINEEVARFVEASLKEDSVAPERVQKVATERRAITVEGKSYYLTDKEKKS